MVKEIKKIHKNFFTPNRSQQRQGIGQKVAGMRFRARQAKYRAPQARRRPSNARMEGPDRDAFLSFVFPGGCHATPRQPSQPTWDRPGEWATRACASGRPAGPERRRHLAACLLTGPRTPLLGSLPRLPRAQTFDRLIFSFPFFHYIGNLLSQFQ